MKSLNQKSGFSGIILLVIVVATVAATLGGVFLYQKSFKKSEIIEPVGKQGPVSLKPQQKQGSAPSQLPPPECIDKKPTDPILPESCKIWFSLQQSQQIQGEGIQQPQQTLPQNQVLDNPLINHNTYITFSSDGKNWNQGALIRKSASVPDLIQLEKDIGKFKKGDLLVYFVDALTMSGPATEQLGVISSSDLGKTWVEQGNIKLSNKKNKGAAVDPSVVQLEDGSLRLYFFGSEITTGDPAQQEGKHKVYSARSYDGISFTVEEGTRFEDDRLTDPEVIFFNGKWFMYYSVGPSSKLAISADGLNFVAVDITGGDVGGVPGALAIDGGVRLFGCRNGISTAISSDGINFRLEQTNILPIQGMICDPAAVKLADGRYALIYKVIQEGAQQTPQQGFQPPPEEVSVKFTGAKYKTISTKPTGWFTTGQDADIMLSGIDFNNSGGPLLFNHPSGLASDGQRLLLADRNNNRILIWNRLPTANVQPDLVLGQKDFTSNNPGIGLDSLNWPTSVATDGEHILVADAENHRILIWNSFPQKSGQRADIVLGGQTDLPDSEQLIRWPWSVWTNGTKVIVASTGARQVLIWNKFPTKDNQPPDIILRSKDFGTPRSIGSNGQNLVIGDHNAFGNKQGNFFWKTFPTKDDEPYDFFMDNLEPLPPPPGGWPEGGSPPVVQGEILYNPVFTPNGKMLGLGHKLHIWDSFPENADDMADLSVGKTAPGEQGYWFKGGEGSRVVLAPNGKVYIPENNGNKIVVFNSLPTESDQRPDFAIGSPDIDTNTLETNFFITNGIPATDGKSLFVSSDFDNKLYVWKNLPDESGAKPDIVYHNVGGPWDNALFGNILALAGQQSVYIWKNLPTSGQSPDLIFTKKIGNTELKFLKGVAVDDRYFYLADHEANKVYVWEGIPYQNSNPKFSLNVTAPWRIDSDGKYLAVTSIWNHRIEIYSVDNLSATSKPSIVGGVGKFNLPESAIVSHGSLFVADTGFNRVFAWKNIEDAIAGQDADVILGEKDIIDTTPEIGKNKVFWPAGLAFDGSYLWVGEFKFSGRLLRFSVNL